jgi:hypothetical protein
VPVGQTRAAEVDPRWHSQASGSERVRSQGSLPCAIFVSTTPPLSAFDNAGHFVVTPTGNGVLTCHGQVEVAPDQDGRRSRRPVRHTRRIYGVGIIVVSASGRTTLVCNVTAH